MSDEYISLRDARFYVAAIIDELNDLVEYGCMDIADLDWRVLMEKVLRINDLHTADVVARDCYDKILIENDAMREQLAAIGKKAGDGMDDVKPVVRCRECIYRKPWAMNATNYFDSEVKYYCNINGIFVTDGFYCADGERRE